MWHVSNSLIYAVAGVLTVCLFMVVRHAIEYYANRRVQLRRDPLTGLPNRLGLEEELAKALAHSRKHGIAVMFVALDGFRQVNDLYGHLAGDAFLKQAGTLIKGALRHADRLARVGGDEFAAVLNVTRNADARQEIAEVAERILAAVRGCSRVQSHHVSVSASIGISLFPEHTHDAAALIRLADTAMRKVKSQTGDAAGFYDPSASENDFRTSEIVVMIRSAIGNGGFRLMFQPMTDRDGFVSQIEALFRIDDSLLSIIPPDEIMDVAEQTGLIHEMGAWILREACKQARAWHNEGYNVPIAVNVSPAQLEAPGFAEQVLACLADAGLTAQALVLEVIEDAPIENAAGHDTLRSESALHDLRAAGVAVSLCDFGAGGSLTITAGMPVDNLKIDGSLMARLLRNPKTLEMVSQTMERARALGYRVIVDGIEEVPQRDLAREMGCDLFQGFLIAPPLEREDATQFLAGQFEPSLAEPQRKLA